MIDNSSNERKHFFGYGGRSPLNWLLFPLLLGYAAAYEFQSSITVSAILSFSVGTLVLSFFLSKKASLWSFFLILSVFTASFGWYHLREPRPSADWQSLPPREVQLSLEVQKIFQQNNSEYVSGIGKIKEINTAKDLRTLKTVFYLKTEKQIHVGDTLSAFGVLEYIHSEEIDSGYFSYLKNNTVHLSFNRASSIRIVSEGKLCKTYLKSHKEKLQKSLRLEAEKPEDLLLSSMLTGDKSDMPEDLFKGFSQSGVLHLFAVSGLHVMTVSLLFYYLLSFLRCPRKLSLTIAVLATTYYVHITGYAPSSTRALLLIYTYSIARILYREPMLWPSIALSALLILIWKPAQFWNPGFQLSYGVTGSIALYGIPLQRYLAQKINLYQWIPEKDLNLFQRNSITAQKYFCSSFAIALSAYISSSLLCIYHFQTFAIGGLLINLLIIPLAPLIIACAVFSGCFGLLGIPTISAFFNHGGYLLIHWIINMTQLHNNIVGNWAHQSYISELIPLACLPLGFLCLFLPSMFRTEQRGYHFLVAPIYFAVVYLGGIIITS